LVSELPPKTTTENAHPANLKPAAVTPAHTHPAPMRSAYQHPNPTATSDESVPHKDDISDKAFQSHTTKNNRCDFSARSTGQKTQSQTAGLTRFYPKPHQNDPTKSTPFSTADGLTTAPNSRQNSQSATDWQASGLNP
jgi:hypothetical protein